MGQAAYLSRIGLGGIPVLVGGGGLTVVTGKTYQITDRTKRLIEAWHPVVVYDDAVPVAAANILSIDHMFGIVVFQPAYTVVGGITMDYRYIPITTEPASFSFTLEVGGEVFDNTTFASAYAQGTAPGFRKRQQGINDASLSLNLHDRISDEWLEVLFSETNPAPGDRHRMFVEIDLLPNAGYNHTIIRGWFVPDTTSESGDVGGEETSEISLLLAGLDKNELGHSLPYDGYFSIRHDQISGI